MVPLPILLAMIFSLGVEVPGEVGPLAGGEVGRRVQVFAWAVLVWGVVSILLSMGIAARSRREGASSRNRLILNGMNRLLEWSSVGLFAWAVFELEWPRVVARNLLVQNLRLLEEVLVIAPFFALQVLVWLVAYPAERVLRGGGSNAKLWSYLAARMRQTAGLVLPLLLMYGLGRSVVEWLVPGELQQPVLQLAVLLTMGLLMLALSPVFVRIAWKTRRLPDGRLRARLERLAHRFGFRCADILVWDTGQGLLNAGVTGVFPWFRYVILSDALIDRLDEREVEAVFGHELGHVVHRHLPYIALFFLGSMGLLGLFDVGLQATLGPGGFLRGWIHDERIALALEWSVSLGLVGAYVLFVFGFVSRQLERQADLFGCLVVSCGEAECPPHGRDSDRGAHLERLPQVPCPVGVGIFMNALVQVAQSNGLILSAPSWRHGSIAGRLAFLRRVSWDPRVALAFETGVRRLRFVLLAVLLGALGVALWLNPELARLH